MTTYTPTALDSNSLSKVALQSMASPRGRILTDLLEQVLVGASENEVLIYQPFSDMYSSGALSPTSFTKQAL